MGAAAGGEQKGRKPAGSGSGDFCSREDAASTAHGLSGTGRLAFKEMQPSVQRRNVTCPPSGCREPRSWPDGFCLSGEMLLPAMLGAQGRGGSQPWTRRGRRPGRTTSVQEEPEHPPSDHKGLVMSLETQTAVLADLSVGPERTRGGVVVAGAGFWPKGTEATVGSHTSRAPTGPFVSQFHLD